MADKTTEPTVNFKRVTKNSPRAAFNGPTPPDSLLDQFADGEMIEGPDKTQWIAKPALPRRWERAKKRVTARS